MANRGEIECGDEATDTITGFKGVVVAVTDWLNGCQRVTIQPREMKDGKTVDPETFDVEQVEVERKSTFGSRLAAAFTGGPHDAPTRSSTPPRR